MEYLACRWHHDQDDEPVDLYSELDDDRWEVRKVEVFRDGRMQYADGDDSLGDTRLGEVRVPPFDDIATDPVFSPRRIGKSVFEEVWRAARSGT